MAIAARKQPILWEEKMAKTDTPDTPEKLERRRFFEVAGKYGFTTAVAGLKRASCKLFFVGFTSVTLISW